MNALLTQKRIIFLGHGQPAGKVANLVLATCALTGQVLRGFTERAFPYSNLGGLDMLEEMPGFIAGVTNPRFEELPTRWDVLCNMETGRITVSKEIGRAETPFMHSSNQSMSSLAHSTASKTEEDAMSASAVNSMKEGRVDIKGETSDTLFIEDVSDCVCSSVTAGQLELVRVSDYNKHSIAHWGDSHPRQVRALLRAFHSPCSKI